jgi:hypothetical protein
MAVLQDEQEEVASVAAAGRLEEGGAVA